MNQIAVLTETEIDEIARRAAQFAVFSFREELSRNAVREIMTKAELAEYLRCDAGKITRLMRKGLPSVRFGDHPRFYKPDVDAWLKTPRTD